MIRVINWTQVTVLPVEAVTIARVLHTTSTVSYHTFTLVSTQTIRDGNGNVGQWVTASDPCMTHEDEITVQTESQSQSQSPRLRFDLFDSCARYKFPSFIHSILNMLHRDLQ